jgi:hypothetical protein
VRVSTSRRTCECREAKEEAEEAEAEEAEVVVGAGPQQSPPQRCAKEASQKGCGDAWEEEEEEEEGERGTSRCM